MTVLNHGGSAETTRSRATRLPCLAMSHENAIQADSLRSWTRSEILMPLAPANARLR